MPKTVLLYTDIKSPYAFIAKAAAYCLADDYDIDLRWLPYTLDIPSYLGSVTDRSPHQWRRVRYSYMDARRYANKQGLTLRGPQKIFQSRPAQIGILYAERQGVLRAYLDLAFELFWKRDLDIEDIAAVAAVLRRAGADADGFAAFAGGAGGAEHDRIRTEAEAAGVFGVPMFVIDGELFWGSDRIELVRERLDALGLRRP
ncbi:disulfide bond formation protein DsbA [Vineibacter terrae]|uniref:2-hydroxychromene-2-carboxylate isomerase n=1 Tax=Vineibacter terrae TaxID=2586908 RepID=A0A5C8PDR7_9HYPH|nr:DsbA family protein [Vineibacter terrae]TXL71701.1 disulfide bond formation protein DsbA [Vineibacter terrae]